MSLRCLRDGAQTDVIGFVAVWDGVRLVVEDRRGRLHDVPAGDVLAIRRVGVSRGRDPLVTRPEQLDALAARAGLAGPALVIRLSTLLDGLEPPPAVPPERARGVFGRAVAAVDGEWVTTDATDPDSLRAIGWWAARQGARSLQVRTPAPDPALPALGFTAVSGCGG